MILYGYMKKYKQVSIYFLIKQAEQLRKLAYINNQKQSKIIRDLFDDFYLKQRKEIK